MTNLLKKIAAYCPCKKEAGTCCLEKGSKKKCLIIAGVVIGFILINLFANNFLQSARFDLTEDNLYTVSKGTRAMLKKNETPVTLRLFFSDKLGEKAPFYANYHRRIKNLLKEISVLSKGKVRVEFLTPEPFTDVEDQAVAAGLTAAPLNESEKVYFGLEGETDKTHKVIAFFQPERENLLEYEIAKLIDSLVHPEKPILAVITDLNLAGQKRAESPWVIWGQLQQSYDLRLIDGGAKKLDKEIDILMLAHAENLSKEMLYAVDQFVLRGGKLLAFVDPHAETESAFAGTSTEQSNSVKVLKPLLENWGVQIEEANVIGDPAASRRVTIQHRTAPEVFDYITWLSLEKDKFDKDDIVMSFLKNINLASAGAITKLEKKKGEDTIKITPLFRTSKTAGKVDVENILMSLPDVKEIKNSFLSGDKSFDVAVRLRGQATSAFPARGKKHLKKSADPINVILVADSDLLADRYWVEEGNFFGKNIIFPFADNGSFIVNAIDHLSGSSDLIGLRSRGVSKRPFTLVRDIQRAAEERYLVKEKELQARLQVTQQKLIALQEKGAASTGMTMTVEEKEVLQDFRDEMVTVRRALRKVRHALIEDIEALQNKIRFINIALIPLLIMLSVVILPIIRRQRKNKKKEK
ncbi:MAG: GldG family protein [Alphaproteobacteria bacterium]